MLKKSNINSGLFITFEGIDGSGKSSQIAKLKKKLKSYNIKKIIFTKEPGGTILGNKIRNLLLSNKNISHISRETQLLLLLAARNDHYINLIKPYLKKNYIVICDRFLDSTYAYQCADNPKLSSVHTKLHNLFFNGFFPDLTILLDIKPDIAIKRIQKRKANNSFDKLSKVFFSRTRNIYLSMAKKNKRMFIVDASNSLNIVHNEILAKILKKLNY